MAAASENFYKIIKIAGAGSFVPLVLIAGPISGYMLGDYLIKKFYFSRYVLFICVIIGFIASAIETIRIIKFMILADKK